MQELKSKVCELQPGQFLAIHGMPGSGKSVLAAGIAHDPEVTLKVFIFNVVFTQWDRR
jgi:DNA replication protein DnaC